MILIEQGDCMDAMGEMHSEYVDAVVTDPPYGIDYLNHEWDKYQTDAGRYQTWAREWGAEALRVSKPGAWLVAFGSPRRYHRLATGLEDAGWTIRDSLAWLYATGFPKHDGRLKPAFEPAVLASKGQAKLRVKGGEGRWPANVAHDGSLGLDTPWYFCAKPSKEERERGCEELPLVAVGGSDGSVAAAERGEAYPPGEKEGAVGMNVVKHRHNHHPTVKPLALMRWVLMLVSDPGDVVLDPFCGSGTTMLACHMDEREGLGYDRDARYVEIANARVKHMARQGTLELDPLI